MKSVNLLHKWGFGDSDTNSTVLVSSNSKKNPENICIKNIKKPDLRSIDDTSNES